MWNGHINTCSLLGSGDKSDISNGMWYPSFKIGISQKKVSLKKMHTSLSCSWYALKETWFSIPIDVMVYGLVSWLGHRHHFKWFVIIIPPWGANKGPLSWDLEGVNIWPAFHKQMDIISGKKVQLIIKTWKLNIENGVFAIRF